MYVIRKLLFVNPLVHRLGFTNNFAVNIVVACFCFTFPFSYMLFRIVVGSLNAETGVLNSDCNVLWKQRKFLCRPLVEQHRPACAACCHHADKRTDPILRPLNPVSSSHSMLSEADSLHFQPKVKTGLLVCDVQFWVYLQLVTLYSVAYFALCF